MAYGDENESLGYEGYMWEPENIEEELTVETAGTKTFHILYILRECIHVTVCLPVSFDDRQ